MYKDMKLYFQDAISKKVFWVYTFHEIYNSFEMLNRDIKNFVKNFLEDWPDEYPESSFWVENEKYKIGCGTVEMFRKEGKKYVI